MNYSDQPHFIGQLPSTWEVLYHWIASSEHQPGLPAVTDQINQRTATQGFDARCEEE